MQDRFIFIVFSALLALSGCVTTGQPSNGFTKIKEEDIRETGRAISKPALRQKLIQQQYDRKNKIDV